MTTKAFNVFGGDDCTADASPITALSPYRGAPPVLVRCASSPTAPRCKPASCEGPRSGPTPAWPHHRGHLRTESHDLINPRSNNVGSEPSGAVSSKSRGPTWADVSGGQLAEIALPRAGFRVPETVDAVGSEPKTENRDSQPPSQVRSAPSPVRPPPCREPRQQHDSDGHRVGSSMRSWCRRPSEDQIMERAGCGRKATSYG